MSQVQETRKPNRFRITSVITRSFSTIIAILIVSFLILSSCATFLQPRPSSVVRTPEHHANIQAIPVDTSVTTNAYSCDFSTPLDSDWILSGYNPANDSFHISAGELNITNQVGGYYFTAARYFDLCKQDFNISFNFRTSSLKTVTSPEIHLLQITAQVLFQNVMANYAWGLEILFEPNYTLKIKHDSGSKAKTPTYAYHYTSVITNDTNYQFWLDFERSSDSVHFQIYNKATSTFLVDSTYITFASSNVSTMPIPNRFLIGNYVGAGAYRWYFDNFSIAYDQAIHSPATTIDATKLTNAITANAAILAASQINATSFKLGTALTNNGTYGLLQTNILAGSRDDVAGDMMSSLSSLYQYTGSTTYLTLAENIWPILKTHQQDDYGFTFGSNATDYSDTLCRIILGLLSLYSSTNDQTYLNEAELMAPNLIIYQVMSNNEARDGAFWGVTGAVYVSQTRGAGTFAWPNLGYFSSYFAVTMLELYKYTENSTYYNHAIMTLDHLMNCTTETGWVWYESYMEWLYGDYNDVCNNGAALWALCEGYKILGDPDYLATAIKVAHYLVHSEFTKDGKSWGVWSGIVKERHNQTDLVYNYLIAVGLQSYLDIYPDDVDVKEAYVANMNFYTSIIGTTDNVNGLTLLGCSGLWGGAYCFNDSNVPGWAGGWWDELGWGDLEWGYVGFYGWQGNILKTMLTERSSTARASSYPSLRSIAIVNETGLHKSVFSSSTELAYVLAQGNLTYFVTVWDPTADTVAEWTAKATQSVTFTLSGLESGGGIYYNVYVDGNRIEQIRCDSGAISFTYSGPWSQHTFEVVQYDPWGPLYDMGPPMLLIGVTVGLIAIMLVAVGSRLKRR